MFMLKSTHKKIIANLEYQAETQKYRANALYRELENLEQAAEVLRYKYNSLLNRWNNLVDRVNDAGGEQFLRNGVQTNAQFSQEDIKRLLQLCHPDKHDGKQSAVEMTQKLLKMKK